MENAEDLNVRRKGLETKLARSAIYQRALFELFSLTSFLLMVLAVGCSAGAVIYGFQNNGPRAGAFALVPPLAAIAAINLRIDARKDWHSRKYHAVNALLYHLRFELSPQATLDQIALVAKEYMGVNIKFRHEYKEYCEFNWTSIASNKS